jgi:hypothetical protein
MTCKSALETAVFWPTLSIRCIYAREILKCPIPQQMKGTYALEFAASLLSMWVHALPMLKRGGYFRR